MMITVDKLTAFCSAIMSLVVQLLYNYACILYYNLSLGMNEKVEYFKQRTFVISAFNLS